MKITNNPNIGKVMKLYNRVGSKPVENTKIDQVNDKLEISEKAKEFQIAAKAFKKLPEVRAEKVNLFKEQIEKGCYNVSGKEIARKIIDSVLIDKKI